MTPEETAIASNPYADGCAFIGNRIMKLKLSWGRNVLFSEFAAVDLKTMSQEYLEFIGWDVDSTIPGDESLRKLGMEFLIDDMKKVNLPGPAW